MPRQMRETFRPVEPSRTYSIDEKSTTAGRLSAFSSSSPASATAYHEDTKATKKQLVMNRRSDSDDEHELADVLARVHHAVRLGCRAQRKRFVNHRRHRPRLQERPDVL